MDPDKPLAWAPAQPGSGEACFGPAADPQASSAKIEVALLTGGGDKPYALGLAAALAAQSIGQDFVGSDDLDVADLRAAPGLRFLNLRGDQRPDVSAATKVVRVIRYYLRLLAYAATARPKVFHLLWNNKFELFDRVCLMWYYRLLGKRVVLTVHNVNAGKRDNNDTWLNRFSLRIQYRLCDHLFVHTEKMKTELVVDFDVPGDRVTVIPFGINDTIPESALTVAEARAELGLAKGDRSLLFFGNIAPYKGLSYLISAMARLPDRALGYRLIIAGRPKGCESYWAKVRQTIDELGLGARVIERIEYVPDEKVEIYFKAADLLVLPYTHVFQSGVLFLGYGFGLPVVATDVGSMEEDIVEGKTGYVCRACDEADLARAIMTYFSSDLFRDLAQCRQEIRDYACRRHSWTTVAELTRQVYARVLSGR